MRRSAVLLFLVFASASVQAAECVTFGRLVPAFAAELGLEAERAKVRFASIDLALASAAGERAAYVLADESSCGASGDCDSMVYLREGKGCYRAVLAFRGKWKGIDRKRGRELASVEIDSRMEGDSAAAGSAIRVERRRRRFEYAPASERYAEAK